MIKRRPNGSPVDWELVRLRYESRVDRSGGPAACHPWTGSMHQKGYGRYSISIAGKRRTFFAHVLGYFLKHHQWPPPGMTIDHLCRFRACQNDDHWEVVTKRINSLRGESPWAKNARKEVCKEGHDDWYLVNNGRGQLVRRCRTCYLLYHRAYHHDHYQPSETPSPFTVNRMKTHCDNGHPLSGENLYMYKGVRSCRACRREASRRSWKKHAPNQRTNYRPGFCPQGHALTGDNVYVHNGHHSCKTCKRESAQRKRDERRSDRGRDTPRRQGEDFNG